MKNILILIMIFLVLSCKHNRDLKESKENIVKVKVDTLKVYNDVLNYLLENRLYYSYLGQKWELLYFDLARNRIDSTTYLKRLNTLKDDVVENDSLKGILYIDGIFEGYTEEIKSLDFVKEYNFDFAEVKTQIKKKNFYTVDSLKSNFVKFKRFRNHDLNKQKKGFEVGSISFSKVVFNQSKDLGILYFSFVCGGKCGEGSLALIKKTNDKWIVKKTQELWNI